RAITVNELHRHLLARLERDEHVSQRLTPVTVCPARAAMMSPALTVLEGWRTRPLEPILLLGASVTPRVGITTTCALTPISALPELPGLMAALSWMTLERVTPLPRMQPHWQTGR